MPMGMPTSCTRLPGMPRTFTSGQRGVPLPPPPLASAVAAVVGATTPWFAVSQRSCKEELIPLCDEASQPSVPVKRQPTEDGGQLVPASAVKKRKMSGTCGGTPGKTPSKSGGTTVKAQPDDDDEEEGQETETVVPDPASWGPPPPGPVFAATGIEFSGRQKRILRDMGATIVQDWSPHITHLVADTFRRTTKMMCAICRGAKVVVPRYLDACRPLTPSGRFSIVDETPFLLQDRLCEGAFALKRNLSDGYSLVGALQLARKNGLLLEGMSIYCFPSVVDKRELPHLVAAAGGTWLTRFPSQPDSASVLLLAERTVSSERERQRRKAHKVYDVELLREAACTQEIRKTAYRLP